MVPVVSFFGYSGSGKTSLLVRVIPALKERGWRVAVIKHAHHGFDIDVPGKDSYRLSEAGCDVVAVSSPEKMVIIERTGTEYSLEQLIPVVSRKVDIVLVEGFKNHDTITLEAAKYGENEVDYVVDFLEQQIRQNRENKEV